MICYVFKVRRSSFTSKTDNKVRSGYNVGLVALEGAKFHLETFIDTKENVFVHQVDKNSFTTGFYEIDIDEFEVYTPKGSQYQKKIISIQSRVPFDDNVRKLF
jgi:hypothetical protein